MSRFFGRRSVGVKREDINWTPGFIDFKGTKGMKGISINPHIGLGDGIQYTSVPENYFRATGEKLVDVSRPWFFDHNPYVVRVHPTQEPKQIQELWNCPTQYAWPSLRDHKVYLSNAEIHATVMKVPVVLNRPRLYRFEDFPYEKREKILLHVDGRSHGYMPAHVIEHVIKKYGPTGQLFQVGWSHIDLGIPKIETPKFWDLAEVISQARMFIGVDSGPSWVAACFPDVVVKKLRSKQKPEDFKNWVPLSEANVHSHWDDRIHTSYNVSDDDVGFTQSYKRL